jgi:hypothetical protein
MVINMDESQLRSIEQIAQFLDGSAEVAFTAHGCDVEPYALTAHQPGAQEL